MPTLCQEAQACEAIQAFLAGDGELTGLLIS
jgi:hypothetical protein